MDLEFNTLEDLYKRIYPALTTKKNELQRSGYKYIKEHDIWQFLSTTKWSNSKGLTLASMVNDILNSNNDKIDQFLKENLAKSGDPR